MIQTGIPGTEQWLDEPVLWDYLKARIAGCPAGITSAGRDWDLQQRLRGAWLAWDAYRRYLAGTGPWAPWAPQANYALPPDQSMHCLGRALDLPGDVRDPGTPRGWMRVHGKAFGFVHVENEDWHFEHPRTTSVTRATASTSTEELSMADIQDIIAKLDGQTDILRRLEADVTGNGTRPTILSWLKARLGGSASSSITSEMRDLATESDVHAIVAAAVKAGGTPDEIAAATVKALGSKLA